MVHILRRDKLVQSERDGNEDADGDSESEQPREEAQTTYPLLQRLRTH
jgi:hypothetical protein